MHLSTLPNADLPPSVPIQPVFVAREHGVLLYTRLTDPLTFARIAERLKALEGRPGFAAGARVHRSTPLPFESDGVAIPPVPPQLMLLIWCEQPDLGLIARAVGPRSLNPWPGHLHADGEWIAIAGMPHLSLVGSTPPTVPDWLLRLIVDQTVAV